MMGPRQEAQRRDFAAAWVAEGESANTLEVAGRNHFDVALDLADPSSTLTQRTIALIRSGAV